MAEISQGKKYGHEINFHGPYLDGQINLNFHVVSSSNDQITTIKEIADLIREDGTIPATGNYTYYEKQEERKEVEKKEELEETEDEALRATPRPIMKIVVGIQVDGDGIKPIFTKEENSGEPKIMTMSLESDSSSDDETIYPTILSAEAPAVLVDSSDDSKLITYGNLKAFAGLTDGRYVRLKSGDAAPGSYLTSSEVDEKIANQASNILHSGDTILYKHDLIVQSGENMPGLAYYYIHMSFYDGSSQQFDSSKLYNYLQAGQEGTGGIISTPVIYMADGYCKETNDSIWETFAIGRGDGEFTSAQLYIFSRRVEHTMRGSKNAG